MGIGPVKAGLYTAVYWGAVGTHPTESNATGLRKPELTGRQQPTRMVTTVARGKL